MAVSGKLEGKVPVVDDVLSSDEQEIYPTNSLEENCIEFELKRIGTVTLIRDRRIWL